MKMTRSHTIFAWRSQAKSRSVNACALPLSPYFNLIYGHRRCEMFTFLNRTVRNRQDISERRQPFSPSYWALALFTFPFRVLKRRSPIDGYYLPSLPVPPPPRPLNQYFGNVSEANNRSISALTFLTACEYQNSHFLGYQIHFQNHHK